VNKGNSFKNRPDSGPDARAGLVAELARKVALFVGSAESLTTDVPGLTLYRHTAPTRPAPATYEPSLAVVVQGRKQVELGANTFVYDGSKYLLTSLDLPVVSRVIEASSQIPYLCLRLKLDMGAVREILTQGEFDSPSTGLDVPAMTTAETTVEFLSAIGRLLDLLHTPADIPFLSPLMQRELIYRILKSAAGQRLRAIATAGDQSYRTARVIAFIKANFTKTLRVEDLAQIAGMSMSTLHHHFRALTSMSPLQYQKQLRLQAAQRMLIEGLDAASAAFSVGYESASQFNREYSRFFGLPPIKHLRAVRPGSLPSPTKPTHHQT
jgi:AraC-like DNA-binding protein